MKKGLLYCMITVCLAVVAFTSCNDLDQAPINRFTDANYWTSAEKAGAVLNTAYNQMFSADYFFNNETLTDNLFQRNVSNEKTISSGLADPANGRFSGEWSDCYRGIKTVHIFLDNVDRVPISETLKNRMKAEARFLRAFLFFRLANWYGAIPWFDYDVSLDETLTISRTPREEVIAWVQKELNEIVDLLPTQQQYAFTDRGRITKGAVMAFLARTYLYDNDWSNVASVCEKIMNKTYGDYALFPSYEGLFLPENEYNEEVILDMGYVPQFRTWSNYYDAIPNTVGGRVSAFAPTQELVDDYVMTNGRPINATASGYNINDPYVNRDPRFSLTIVCDGYQWKRPDGTISTIYINPNGTTTSNDTYSAGSQTATPTGYYLRKWYDPTSTASLASGLNLILIRYADILLMYAEAKNELNQMNESIWDNTIGAIRKRAGFTDFGALDYGSNASQLDMRDVIRRERRCELVMEGLRIHDIRRWKTAESVLNGNPHGARFADNGTSNLVLDARKFNKNRDYLWPVPQSQIDINPNLKPQNDNW